MNQTLGEWLVSYGTQAFEIIGTLAFALSGLIEAARKKLDIVGMAIVTSLAAFGGGTLRDILLDRRPFFWVQNEIWIWVILLMCAFALFFMRARHIELTERSMQWPDALGLGIFAASGTQIAITAGMSPIIAVVMGVITPVFGGVLRDVVVNEIPRAFNDHQPYAVIAFAGGWLVVVLNLLGWPAFWAIGVSALAITVLRLMAVVFGWRLPTWRV
ncbi:unannotated protein [freshwater metagenome]|uniref:Unannotated protein n=1 Tax=freshwater metagenome TaxID=449393 RepID=A0A6J6J9L1_9ZZZZ|nr:trimeric intracellular cation channel family protein [Actinomycetota bacterium]